MRSGAVILAVLTICPAAWATDFHVDNAATGSNSGASWADAWDSFASIDWGSVNPGDTIYISGGATSKTYNEQLTVGAGGSNGSLVTIDIGANSPSPSGHSGQVRIDGEGSREFCISSRSHSYVAVKNLYCEDAADKGIRIENQGSIVEGNTFHSIDGQAIHLYACDDCIVRGNRVTTDDDIPQQTDGIIVYGGSNNVIVEKNWLYLTNQNDCGACHNDCIQSNRCTNFTARWNYCENTKNATGNAQGIYTTEMYGDVKYYGNVVVLHYGPNGLASRNLSEGTARTYMYNNTVQCGGYRCLVVTEAPDPVIKNNLVWQTGIGDVILMTGWSGSASNLDNNLWYAPNANGNDFDFNGGSRTWSYWTSTMGFDPNGYNQDPSLDSCLRPDNSGDPSVGAGQVLAGEDQNGLSTSLCGQTAPGDFQPVTLVDRNAGDPTWDIGAYEYGGGTDAPPRAPENLRVE